jgi:hypothetical protein
MFMEIGVQHYYVYLGSHAAFSQQLGVVISSMDKLDDMKNTGILLRLVV